VFLRVSAYPENEMLRQPHSMIRHPDMPRCVFTLLWDSLLARQEIFAYVVNLAGDDAHYWIFARVTPSIDGQGQVVGYCSNRRLPSRPALDQIRPLHADLLAEERRHPRPADAIAASTRLLEDRLRVRGLTCDEFVWSLAGSGVVA